MSVSQPLTLLLHVLPPQGTENWNQIRSKIAVLPSSEAAAVLQRPGRGVLHQQICAAWSLSRELVKSPRCDPAPVRHSGKYNFHGAASCATASSPTAACFQMGNISKARQILSHMLNQCLKNSGVWSWNILSWIKWQQHVQSGLLLIHHPCLCCQLANSVHFCSWNQGNAMRNYLSLRKKPLRNSVASGENRRNCNHFYLSLISVWDCLGIFWGLLQLTASSFGEIRFFLEAERWLKAVEPCG